MKRFLYRHGLKLPSYRYFLFLPLLCFSCASFDNLSQGYNASREAIWEAMNHSIEKIYGGVQNVSTQPPKITSKLLLRDAEFNIDKSATQAIAKLSGFSRPYTVDVIVKLYPDRDNLREFSLDRKSAQKLLEEIRQYLAKKRSSFYIQDLFEPY